ncbi:MAG: hypothetical protein MHM6MM_000121 [Cercozoa sp. M6MM]
MSQSHASASLRSGAGSSVHQTNSTIRSTPCRVSAQVGIDSDAIQSLGMQHGQFSNLLSNFLANLLQVKQDEVYVSVCKQSFLDAYQKAFMHVDLYCPPTALDSFLDSDLRSLSECISGVLAHELRCDSVAEIAVKLMVVPARVFVANECSFPAEATARIEEEAVKSGKYDAFLQQKQEVLAIETLRMALRTHGSSYATSFLEIDTERKGVLTAKDIRDYMVRKNFEASTILKVESALARFTASNEINFVSFVAFLNVPRHLYDSQQVHYNILFHTSVPEFSFPFLYFLNARQLQFETEARRSR